jgi:hypothetical protein
MSKTTPVVFALAVASLILFGAGCNPFQSVQNKIGATVAEGIVNKATGGNVNINAQGQQVTYTDNKTGATSAFGEDVKLPADFPKDAYIYPGTKVTGVTTSKENGVTAWVMLTTSDSAKTVADWYAKDAKDEGWTEESSFTMNEVETRSYTKGSATLTMTATADKEKGGTTIVVTYVEKANQ